MADGMATQAVLSPEAVQAFFALLGRAIRSMTQRRLLRAVEYFGRVAADSRLLWGDKVALCVVHAKHRHSFVLVAQAQATITVNEAAPLWREAQRLLAECRCILNARLAANTCLVGRCFAVEEDFFVRYNVMLMEAGGVALTTQEKAAFRSVKREVGYEACIDAAELGLRFAYPAALLAGAQVKPPPLTGEERNETQAFTLRCVGIMATATRIHESCHQSFAKVVRDLLASNDLEQPFKEERARVWLPLALRHRLAQQNAQRARGVSEEEDAEDAALGKKFYETL